MKKILIFCLSICALVLAAYGAAWIPIKKTVASAGTPEQLSTSDTRYRKMILVANKTARGTNTSRIWIQTSGTNDEGGFYLDPGERFAITDLDNGTAPSEVWIDVVSDGDGLVATCIP